MSIVKDSSRDNVHYSPINQEKEKPVEEVKNYGFGKRHIQVFLLFSSCFASFLIRTHISLTVVAMTSEQITENIFNFKTFKWNKATQEAIIGSFFIGYTAMQIPWGMLAHKIGGKLTILIGLALNGFLSIITPWIAHYGDYNWVCVVRVIQGLAQSSLFSGVYTMLGRWAPPVERARFLSFAGAGTNMGLVLASPLAGFLSTTPIGWPLTFWVVGAIDLIVALLMYTLGASIPEKHPSINNKEREYILNSIQQKPVKNKNTPWLSILTSVPVLIIAINHTANSILATFIINESPSYFKEILGLSIRTNGIFNALPFMTGALSLLAFGQLSDYAINKEYVSLHTARKIMNSIGLYSPAILLMGVVLSSNQVISICCLVLCLTLHQAAQIGYAVNQVDLAPNYAGTIMSVTNLFGSLLGGLGVPILVSLVLTDVKNHTKWILLSSICCSIAAVAATLFNIFAKAKRQPWNEPEDNPDSKSTGNQEARRSFILSGVTESVNID